jgi:hypothetical protein
MRYADKHKEIEGVIHKLCPDCNQWYLMDAEHFKVQPSKKDGYSDKCRVCQEKYNHEHYMLNREHQIKSARRRQLDNHEDYLIYIKTYRKERYKTDEVLRQREKDNSDRRRKEGKQKEWLQSESGKQSSKKNGKKRLAKKHIISRAEWKACKEYFKDEDGDYCCAYCGLKIQNHTRIYAGKIQYIDLHKEHVDDDGSLYLNNCVPSCQTCNTNKFQKELNEWYNKDNPKFKQWRLDKIIKWITEDYKLYFEGFRPRHKYNKKKSA